jgi:hypothetical protein
MFKTLLILIIVAILMEDGLTIRKSEEEKREDDEVAKAVNKTLAEEEKKRREEEDEKKRQLEQEKKQKGTGQKDRDEKASVEKQEGQDGVCPPVNHTCPKQEECGPCPEIGQCPPCGPCPEEKACPEEKICPEEKVCLPCRPCGPCPPVKPCPSLNQTSRTASDGCPEASGLSVPVAMVVGALISLGTMGLAAVVGLILRYVPPLISGILFLTVIFVVWFLSSQYPDVAREAGGRVVAALREATVALGHRIMEAIRHHNDQVGLPVNSILL